MDLSLDRKIATGAFGVDMRHTVLSPPDTVTSRNDLRVDTVSQGERDVPIPSAEWQTSCLPHPSPRFKLVSAWDLYDSDMNSCQEQSALAVSDVGLTVLLTVSGRALFISTGLRMPRLTIEWE